MSKSTIERRRTSPRKSQGSTFREAAQTIVRVAKGFYERGWVLGTSGNLSVLTKTDPLRLAITGSGLDKGALEPQHVLEIDAKEGVRLGRGKPSSETAIHIAIIRACAAGAVFHTHSVWGTVLSENHAREGGVVFTGYEMLKGLDGVRTHEHAEWLPIIENSQNMNELSASVAELLAANPEIHGFLLRGHGLYTWGKTARDAKRHVEILEFLMEVLGRSNPNSASL